MSNGNKTASGKGSSGISPRKLHQEHLMSLLLGMLVYRKAEAGEHICYVKGYTRILAEKYGKLYGEKEMSNQRVEKLVKAAGLHDVGKLAMPDSVLERQGHLDEFEEELLKEHVIKGQQIVGAVAYTEDTEYWRICENVCLYHHEKYDGSGYPHQLKGNQIPVEAQLVALADMYDALLHRMEQQSHTTEQAYHRLMQGDCGGLSPAMEHCLQEARWELERFRLN